MEPTVLQDIKKIKYLIKNDKKKELKKFCNNFTPAYNLILLSRLSTLEKIRWSEINYN